MTNLADSYGARLTLLEVVAERLEANVAALLSGNQRVEYVRGRAKSVDRFLAKANKMVDGHPKYAEPLVQIQDQVGVRIVTYFLSDVTEIAQTIRRYFHGIEDLLRVPDDENEFGYIGHHLILVVPSDICADLDKASLPDFFELQIQTLFQHAWAEAEHDLGYKPSATLTSHQKRQLAFTAAQAWGADQIYEELHRATESV